MTRRRGQARAPAPYPRTARVNEVLRQVLAESLERLEDFDERLGMLTVTSVEISPDLSHAVVYLSSVPEGVMGVLSARRAELQRAIGRQVRLKRTPHLEFSQDPAVTQGERVEEILRHLHCGDVRHPDDAQHIGSADEEPDSEDPTSLGEGSAN